LFEEGGGCLLIRALGQHEIKGVAEFINGSIQVNPFTLDFDIGFIHPPRSRNSTFTFLAAKAKEFEYWITPCLT